MTVNGLFEKVERWVIHENFEFKAIKNEENVFHFLIRHGGTYGTPVEIFEPKKQPGILVIGAKADLKNSQILRYKQMSELEQKKFKDKVSEFCNSIKAVHRFLEEDGKKKIGVYVVLDKKSEINQESIPEAINKVSEMHEKTRMFLLKTF